MSFWNEQWNLGKEIYGYSNWRQKRRIFLFTTRAFKNKRQIEEFNAFFNQYEAYPNLLTVQPGLYEVLSRVFLYKNSTADERWKALKNHFVMLPNYFTKESIQGLYDLDESKGISLWHNEELELEALLHFNPGQRKEGFLTLFLRYKGEGIYHINFRLGKGFQGENAIWVGTIQSYKDVLNKTKKLTKQMHGYRPKNFIFFVLRQLATVLNIHSMYAVSDEGFYTNSHLIRFKRHKLVKFDPFWEELGGTECPEDNRFYRIPVEEERKTYETAKTHKRNMYRKRYEMLDAWIAEIKERSKEFCVNNKGE